MSRVVLCHEGDLSLLLDMNNSQTQRNLLGGTSFTLQDILTLISTRGIDRLRLGANDPVHYHCFFCQDGPVPQFWRNAYNVALANNNVLRRRQSQQLTPPRLMPTQRNMNLTQSQERQRQDHIARRRSGTVQDNPFATPTGPPSYTMNESTTPSPGQGARTSSLSRTFSSQPVLPSPPRVSRLLFPRERGRGRGREVNLTARRKDVIRRERRLSRRRREDSLRKRRKK